MNDRFTSLRYPLSVDAGLGRLAEEPDYAEHVEQLIRQVLFTSPGDRVNRPEFGCGVRRMVFAPNSRESASLAQATVYQSLTRWLGGLIELQRVEVAAREELLEISIVYLLRARQERRLLNVEVTL